MPAITPASAVVFTPAAVRTLQNPDFGIGILRPVPAPLAADSALDEAYHLGYAATLDADGDAEPPARHGDRERAAWAAGADDARAEILSRYEALEDEYACAANFWGVD